MRHITLALLLLAGSIAPAYANKATVDDRKSISASVSNCIHDRESGCVNPNPFKAGSVDIGAAVVVQDYFALADWKSADGTRRGQVFLWTKGCQIWTVGPVSIGRALRMDEIKTYMGKFTRGISSSKDVPRMLVDELSQMEADDVAYLRVPPGPSC